jgi:L-ascorbate metabolism protein UlaG (beta-lactamase superfamily)
MRKFKVISLFLITTAIMTFNSSAQSDYEHDTFDSSVGKLELWFIGHGTLMFKAGGVVIHIDPVSREGDYNLLPGADLVLITHSHGDHLDPQALKMICNDNTTIICNEGSSDKIDNPVILKNGESLDLEDKLGLSLSIEAVPAYNIKHERSPGNPFHPKGDGNGYILNVGDKRIYVAGDTENITEMAKLDNIDIAFLPMNLPYTMSPEMVSEAALMFMPKILYPYHFGTTNTDELVVLLEGRDIDVRIRNF